MQDLVWKAVREMWIPSKGHVSILKSQRALLGHFVKVPLHEKQVEVLGSNRVPYLMNCVDTLPNSNDGGRRATDGRALRTVVLGHGLGSGLGLFFQNYDGLLKHFDRIVAFDWVGFGNSSRPEYENGPEFFTEPLRQFLNSIRVDSGEEFTLVGHSLGGYLSGMFASKYSDMIKRLVLASPVGFAPKPPGGAVTEAELGRGFQMVMEAWNRGVTPSFLLRLSGPRGPNWVNDVVERRFRKRWPENENQLIAEYLYQINAHVASGEDAMQGLLEPVHYGDRVGMFAKTPLSEVLPQMVEGNRNVPVNILYGDHDWLSESYNPLYRCNDAAASLNAQYGMTVTIDTLPRAGHHLYIDNSIGFHEYISQVALEGPHQ